MTNKDTIAYLKTLIADCDHESKSLTLDPEYCGEKLPTTELSTTEQMQDFDSLYQKAHAKVERLLVIRDRSTQEIRKRLLREQYPEQVVDALIERCLECGLLDDMRFAETLIRSKLRVGKGIVGITYDLRSYGIDEKQISGYPERFLADAPDQFEMAKTFLESHPPTAKNKRQAAYAKLIRKGFSSDIAQRVSRLWYETNYDSLSS